MSSHHPQFNKVRGAARFENFFELSAPGSGIEALCDLYDCGIGLPARNLPVWKSCEELTKEVLARYSDDLDIREKLNNGEFLPAPRLLELNLLSAYRSYFVQCLAGSMPPDIEINVTCPRLYLNTSGREARIEALMCCQVICGDVLKYLIWDIDDYVFLSDAPMAICLSGTASEVLHRNARPGQVLYSSQAYNEILENVKHEGLDALPYHLARQAEWLIWQRAGKEGHLSAEAPSRFIGFGCTPLQYTPGEFCFDLLPFGSAYVRFGHRRSGEIVPVIIDVSAEDAVQAA